MSFLPTFEPSSADPRPSFISYLRSSKRIAALCGAGLSAPSGIPTFRGKGGIWQKYNVFDVDTRDALDANPVLLWQFFSHRRHIAVTARPNRAHFALKELVRYKPNFLTITQNVDGLSERAGHPEHSLEQVHGRVNGVKCRKDDCSYRAGLDPTQPITPALAVPPDIDFDAPLPIISKEDLPHCPKCGSILGPDVILFGEPLQEESIDRVEDWLEKDKVDLMLVIGTTAVVFPVAGYVDMARDQGARVAVFNTEEAPEHSTAVVREGLDWFFRGSVDETLPDLFKEAFGEDFHIHEEMATAAENQKVAS